MNIARAFLWWLVWATANTASAQEPKPPVPSDADVRQIISARVDKAKHGTAMVVGIVDPRGRRIIAYGVPRASDPRTVDGDTVFEIGSVTKVFTALALANAVTRREVSLDDPVAKLLPGVRVPARGRAITLQDLATHTSGLPRLPSNMAPKDPSNPYVDYTVDQLHAFLASHQLSRDVGVQYEYSNLGGGLLGHALASRAGVTYEALIDARIVKPLGMRSTRITVTDEMRARLAVGHSPSGETVSNWDLPTLAGAGALRSTANDLLTFISAAMNSEGPLASSFARLPTVRRQTGAPNLDIALGWHVLRLHGRDLLWHNGGTGGYRSFVGFDPIERVGVVVLSNTGAPVGVDDIGRHLLDARSPVLPEDSPLLAPKPTRTTIQMAPSTFDRFVGRYQLAPQAIVTINRKDGRFFTQLTGQPELEIYPQAQTTFFLKVVDAQLTFETDAAGRGVAMVLRQAGRDQRAPRIEGDPIVPKEVALDAATLEGYVGRYQLTPQAVISVTRQENRLFAQLTGQPSVEVFASAPKDFFYKVVDARLLFEVDGWGQAIAVVLRQFVRDARAPRVP